MEWQILGYSVQLSLSSQRLEFNPRPVIMGFAVHKWYCERFFSEYFHFCSIIIIPLMLHIPPFTYHKFYIILATYSGVKRYTSAHGSAKM